MSEQPNETVEFTLPTSLGLTAEQARELEGRFTSQLIEVLQGKHTDAVARAKPKEKVKQKVQMQVEIA